MTRTQTLDALLVKKGKIEKMLLTAKGKRAKNLQEELKLCNEALVYVVGKILGMV